MYKDFFMYIYLYMYSFMFIHFHFFIYVVNYPVLSQDLRLHSKKGFGHGASCPGTFKVLRGSAAPPENPQEAAIDFEFAGCFVGEKDVFFKRLQAM